MLKAWLIGFITGVLTGRAWAVPFVVQTDAVAVVAVLALLGAAAARFIGGLRRRRVAAAACAVCACYWGLAHSAPPATDLARAVVVKTAVADTASGTVLIESDGKFYEVNGPQTEGAVGRVQAYPGRRLFAPSYAVLTPVYIPPRRGAGPWGRAVAAVRAAVKERTARLPAFDQSWLAGFVAGEKAELPVRVRDAFKATGLYHLLVVSGLHVSLMALILCLMIQAPLQAAYAARLLPAGRWPQYAASMQVLGVAAAIFYLAVTGSSVAAQRSALLFGTYQLSLIFVGIMPLPLRLQWTAVVQTVVFPLGFVSEAALMSWAAYLLVLVPLASAEAKGGARAGWRELLWLQAKLLVLTSAIFGQTPWLGLAANILVVPLFPLILAAGIAALAAGPGVVQELCLVVHRAFVVLVDFIAGFAVHWPWLAPLADTQPLWVRPAATGLGAIILLNACRDLTISTYDPDP